MTNTGPVEGTVIKPFRELGKLRSLVWYRWLYLANAVGLILFQPPPPLP